MDQLGISKFSDTYDDELDKIKANLYKYPDIALEVAWTKNGNIYDFDARISELYDISFE